MDVAKYARTTDDIVNFHQGENQCDPKIEIDMGALRLVEAYLVDSSLAVTKTFASVPVVGSAAEGTYNLAYLPQTQQS